MFEVSTKVDYGLLILFELMQAGPNSYLSLADIADKNHVSQKYLSQVIIPLRQAGIVASREGKGGGYALTRSPDKINLRVVVEAIDGPLQLTRCMTTTHQCPAEHGCGTKPVWHKVKQSIYQLLEEQTLANVC